MGLRKALEELRDDEGLGVAMGVAEGWWMSLEDMGESGSREERLAIEVLRRGVGGFIEANVDDWRLVVANQVAERG